MPSARPAGADRLLVVSAPVAGILTALRDVPDPVFAEAMVGPGLAILPEDDQQDPSVTAVAPVAGTLVTVHPHAFVVLSPGGRAVLVHLGIDTVQLKGEGFTLHAGVGDEVAVGDPVVTWSPRAVAEGGRSTLVPVVALDTDPASLHSQTPTGSRVAAGQSLFVWT